MWVQDEHRQWYKSAQKSEKNQDQVPITKQKTTSRRLTRRPKPPELPNKGEHLLARANSSQTVFSQSLVSPQKGEQLPARAKSNQAIYSQPPSLPPRPSHSQSAEKPYLSKFQRPPSASDLQTFQHRSRQRLSATAETTAHDLLILSSSDRAFKNRKESATSPIAYKKAEKKPLFKALYSFQARTPRELSFERGDILVAIEQTKDEIDEMQWRKTRHLKSGKEGYAPRSYIEEVEYNVPQITKEHLHNRTINQGRVEQDLVLEKSSLGLSNPKQTKQSRSVSRTRASSFRLNRTNIYVSPIAKHNGYATDVIIVKGESGQIATTDFNVRFTGFSRGAAYVGTPVEVIVDGNSYFRMVMADNGVCRFENDSLQCEEAVLKKLTNASIKAGRHELVYQHKFVRDDELMVNIVRAYIWVWHYTDYVLVSDVDGTITISDIGGLFSSTILRKMGFKRGYAHEGVCNLYKMIQAKTNCKILYLTARPLNLVKETRDYIYGLQQHSLENAHKLPVGPIVTDTTDILGSLKRELRACFLRCGRDVLKHPVFVATFGNKESDVAAYKASGAPVLTMFLIDTSSNIRIVGGPDRALLNSYSDPRLVKLILERVTLIQNGKLPQPP